MRRERERKGLTQNDIAMRLHVSESRIGKIESLRVGVTPDFLAEIERVLAEPAQEAAV
jgi:transcriptional regulator with XRE-family HTH domain